MTRDCEDKKSERKERKYNWFEFSQTAEAQENVYTTKTTTIEMKTAGRAVLVLHTKIQRKHCTTVQALHYSASTALQCKNCTTVQELH